MNMTPKMEEEVLAVLRQPMDDVVGWVCHALETIFNGVMEVEAQRLTRRRSGKGPALDHRSWFYTRCHILDIFQQIPGFPHFINKFYFSKRLIYRNAFTINDVTAQDDCIYRFTVFGNNVKNIIPVVGDMHIRHDQTH